ncbi:MAG: hypothetical protein ACPGOV_04020 [Magnetovibrionaceae bacterium]
MLTQQTLSRLGARTIALCLIGGALAACGHVDEYEASVYDREPTYCYQSLAGVTCYREPNARDEARLVSYFGPHPSRYDKPEVEPRDIAAVTPPPMIETWVKEPEPVPGLPIRAGHRAPDYEPLGVPLGVVQARALPESDPLPPPEGLLERP